MRAVIAFVIAFVTYTQVYLFLFNSGRTSVDPGKALGVMVGLGALSAGLQMLGLSRSPRGAEFSREERRLQWMFIGWIVAFVGVAAISFLAGPGDEASLRALKTVIVLTGVTGAAHLATSDRYLTRAAIYGVIAAIIVTVLNNALEFAQVTTLFQGDVRRGAGFYVNPNIAGVMLNLGMVVTVSYVPPQHRLKYCLLIGAGVLLTFSRGGMLVWIVATFLMGYFRFFALSRYLAAGMAVVVAVVVLSLQFGLISLGDDLVRDLGADAASRLVYSGQDESVAGRLFQAELAWQLFQGAPAFGHGIGSSMSFGSQPHNTFLRLAVEMGAVGVALFVALLALPLLRSGRIGVAFVSAFILHSFFTHNMLDFPGRWLALMLSLKVLDALPAARARHGGRTPTPANVPGVGRLPSVHG